MKKIILIAAALLMGFSVEAQPPRWIVNGSLVNMTPAGGYATTSGPTISNTDANIQLGSSVALNNAGGLVFSVVGNRIFDCYNNPVGYLPGYRDNGYNTGEDYSLEGWKLRTRVSASQIIPIPGSCNKFYVIYNLYADFMGSNSLVFVCIDVTSGTPVVSCLSPTTGTPGSFPLTYMGATLISQYCCELGAVNWAVSKPYNISQDRYLFAVGKGGPAGSGVGQVSRFTINSTGISAGTTIAQASTAPSVFPSDNAFLNGEVELSPDQKHLAWNCVDLGGINSVFQISLTPSYGFSAGSAKRFINSNPLEKVAGIEYNAGSTHLFEIGTINQLQRVPVTASSMTNFSTAGVPPGSGFLNSQLEVGVSGQLYAVSNNDNQMYRLESLPPLYTSTFAVPTGVIHSPLGSTSPVLWTMNCKYQLPRQIDGEEYRATGFAPISYLSFNLNGTVAPPTIGTLSNVYTCQPLILSNTSTDPNVYPAGMAASYRVKVESVDATGAYITCGTCLGTYTHDFTLADVLSLDLQSMPGTNGNWLSDPAHFGFYKISMTIVDACGNETGTYATYIKLNAPPSAATLDLKINNGLTGTPCDAPTVATACLTGRYSCSFNLGTAGSTFGSNNIDRYQRIIDEYDPLTSTYTNIYTEPMTAVPSSGALTALSLNGIVIAGSAGYFTTKMGKTYRFTVNAENVCSSASDVNYFTIDASAVYKKADPNAVVTTSLEENVSLLQNPVQNSLQLQAIINEAASFTCIVYDMTGKITQRTEIAIAKGSSNVTIALENAMANGMYFYTLSNGYQSYKGKFVKQ